MITNLLKLFKIFSNVVVSVVPKLFFFVIDIPQNISKQKVLKVLNAKLQQILEIWFLLKFLQYICSKESLFFNNRDE